MAELYDRFAHALDPFSEARDEAEKDFLELLSAHYEALLYRLKAQHVAETGTERLFVPNISFRDFRREAISQCKAYLKANR